MVRLAAWLWASTFALVHIYWITGGRLGLPHDVHVTPGSPLYWAALAAIPSLTISGIAAIGAAWRIDRIASRFATFLVAITALFCLVHSAPPLLAYCADLLAGPSPSLSERERYALWLYEPNWLLGGILFSLTLSSMSSALEETSWENMLRKFMRSKPLPDLKS